MRIIAYRLEQRLRTTTKRHVTKKGFALSDACDFRISKMIVTGVERMANAGVLERQDKIKMAEDGLCRLVAYMSKKLSFSPEEFPVIEEGMLEDALKKLCPMWPFC